MKPDLAIRLRPASDQDTEFAKNIHHRAYHDVIVKQFGSWNLQRQDEYFAIGWSKQGFQIIELDQTPCGYLRFEDMPGETYIHELVIDPTYHNLGIGSYLLRRMQDGAKQKNAKLTLQVLRVNRAYDLYTREGFRKIGESETHYQMEWIAGLT